MWLTAQFNFPIEGYPEVPRGWKCLLHMAKNMSTELILANIDPTTMTDEQLKTEVRLHLKGGAISFDIPNERDFVGLLDGLWRWFTNEIWLGSAFLLDFTLFIIFFTIWMLSGRFRVSAIVSWAASFGAYMSIGSGQRKSFLIPFNLCCLVGVLAEVVGALTNAYFL